uniref:Rho guanine nucleotide exchange factor 11 n=1 Tax=Ornithorhynchus anatinus TaxID=9258 RepID=A0A6I8N6N9_ORNAN
DQHGFGFTVSGDRVVLVQSVRPGECPPGTRGPTITDTLPSPRPLAAGAYVALTLLGSSPASGGFSGLQRDPGPPPAPRSPPAESPPPPPPGPPPERITGPRPLQVSVPARPPAPPRPLLPPPAGSPVPARRRPPPPRSRFPQDSEVQKHAAQILLNMLRQEERELQLGHPRPLGPGRRGAGGGRGPDAGPRVASRLRRPSPTQSLPSGKSVFPDPGPDGPHTSPVVASRGARRHRRRGSEPLPGPASEQGSDRGPKPLIIGPEEDYDPGYFNDECDALFQDLEKLKARPAHLGIFLRYIFTQADPNPLLFYLCAEVFQQTGPKDSRNLGKTIWSVFLEKAAPLRVYVPDALLDDFDLRLRNNEDVRVAMSEAQAAALPDIQEQIQDYRRKRTMGLGSLYGENDLPDLDGDPLRERELAEKQLVALGDLVSRYEEDKSTAMEFALNTYATHAGLRGKEARSCGPADKTPSAPDKDKWLPFFPKTKKSANSKKERDALEDRKRNPILKYIGKPKGSSQSIKPGNVRTMIQHFENSQNYGAPAAAGPPGQRLSTGSFPEELLPGDSCRSEVKLGRSESLKGREELKRSRKAENVPRSRSDVDMDAAAEAARLHQSTSSSASSLSTRSLENPTPPYTPKMGRRSIESPSLSFPGEPLLPHLREDDLGRLSDLEPELEAQNWQHTVGRDVVAGLSQREIERQEVINELFVTEASHLRTLRVLDIVFYQPMRRDNLLAPQELNCLFPNLPDIIDIHNSWCEAMKKLRESGPVVKEVGDLMLTRFDGEGREELQEAAAQFCSQQSIALEIIRVKQRKESRFQLFMQEAESLPQCRRLQLRDLIVAEMQRLTKYPLLLDSILKHTDDDVPEREKLGRARDQCREILRFVNEALKQAENRHRLEGYQRRLDATSLERASNPLAAEFKSLDLTSRTMIHEGPLAWRISKDKTVDVLVVLLEDLLVLLQRQQDEKLLLKVHSKSAPGSSDSSKQSFVPVLKLNAVLVRSVATDKRAFFIICTSELGPPQIYELVAQTSLERNTGQSRGPSADPHPRPLPPAPPQTARLPPLPRRCGVLPSPHGGQTGARGGFPAGARLTAPLPHPALLPPSPPAPPVESLRHLILLTLLAGPGTEPTSDGAEDPPTPPRRGHAASPRGGPADRRGGEEEKGAGGPGRGSLTSLGQLPPRTRNSGIWESPELDGELDGGDGPAGAAGPPDPSPGGYKVVRRGEAGGGRGPGGAPPARPDLRSLSLPTPTRRDPGNCFYISVPPGRRDLNAGALGPGTPEVGTPRRADGWHLELGPPAGRVTGAVQRGIDPIFHTIQQLTLKLHRLKVREGRGLGAGDAPGTRRGPVGRAGNRKDPGSHPASAARPLCRLGRVAWFLWASVPSSGKWGLKDGEPREGRAPRPT